MIHAYNEFYLNDAKQNLAVFLILQLSRGCQGENWRKKYFCMCIRIGISPTEHF